MKIDNLYMNVIVGIIMGSDLDLFIMKEAIVICEEFNIFLEVVIVFVYCIF